MTTRERSAEDRTVAFVDTVRHALALSSRANLLREQARQSLEVAASLAGDRGQHVDARTLRDVASELRTLNVYGRGAITSIADSYHIRTMAGQTGTRDRSGAGDRWPARADVVYWLEDESGSVIYIGKSKHLSSRVRGHGEKDWAVVHWRICEDRDEASRLEADLIFQHQPPLNREGRSYRMERTA